MHVLLDTNIPLNMYLHGVVERPMPLESGKVLAAAADKRFTAYLTPTGYSNTFYFLRKHLGQAAAKAHSQELLEVVSILPQTHTVFRNAMGSNWSDVEDAGQYYAALAMARMTHLCTCNTKHYKQAQRIAVISPAALLKLL
jgi:hypothetical protein